jgi:hypothetical protein
MRFRAADWGHLPAVHAPFDFRQGHLEVRVQIDRRRIAAGPWGLLRALRPDRQFQQLHDVVPIDLQQLSGRSASGPP